MPTEHKCELCGKQFTAPSRLRTHQNSKTPCVIQHLDNADLNNPFRCTYCNKIYASRHSLWGHHKVCKKKLEEDNKNKKPTEIDELKENIKQKTDKLDKLEKMFIDMIKTQKELIERISGKETAKIENNIDTVNINNTNITLNNYNTPTMPQIDFDKIRNCRGLHRLLIKEIYFNPDIPENHVVYPAVLGKRNPRDRCMALYENGWRKKTGDTLNDALDKISTVAFNVGTHLLRDNEQMLRDQYNAAGRPVEFKTRIANFKAREEMATSDDIFEMAIEFSPSMKKPNV